MTFIVSFLYLIGTNNRIKIILKSSTYQKNFILIYYNIIHCHSTYLSSNNTKKNLSLYFYFFYFFASKKKKYLIIIIKKLENFY